LAANDVFGDAYINARGAPGQVVDRKSHTLVNAIIAAGHGLKTPVSALEPAPTRPEKFRTGRIHQR